VPGLLEFQLFEESKTFCATAHGNYYVAIQLEWHDVSLPKRVFTIVLSKFLLLSKLMIRTSTCFSSLVVVDLGQFLFVYLHSILPANIATGKQ
jgi:hypothetical protein